MSDYLWDKTGEPDAEAERLEELLGQLRFQPTPFDLPAELPAREHRAPRAPRTVLSWPRLALAASLTLAALAGAWLMFRQQTGATHDAPQVVRQNNQANTDEHRSAAVAPKANDAANENNAGDERKTNGTPVATPSKGHETRREFRAGGRPQPRLPDLTKDTPRRLPRAVAPHVSRNELVVAPKRGKNLPTPGVAPRREERAQLAAEREAAEKVLYALRVTSEKLSYARRQVQDARPGEENR